MTETVQNGTIDLAWFAPQDDMQLPPLPAGGVQLRAQLEEIDAMVTASMGTLLAQLYREHRRLERRLRWLGRCRFWSSVLFGVSLLGLINFGLSMVLWGTEVGHLFEMLHLLGQIPIAGIAAVIGVCLLMASDLPDAVRDEMQALKRSEARFRRPG
jgi:hypothetical protein